MLETFWNEPMAIVWWIQVYPWTAVRIWVAGMLVVGYAMRWLLTTEWARRHDELPFAMIVFWPPILPAAMLLGVLELALRTGDYMLRGLDWLVFMASHRKIAEDEWGVLYSARRPEGPVTRIKLQSDQGTHWVQTPPGITVPKQAIAASFRLNKTSDYDPVVQT